MSWQISGALTSTPAGGSARSLTAALTDAAARDLYGAIGSRGTEMPGIVPQEAAGIASAI